MNSSESAGLTREKVETHFQNTTIVLDIGGTFENKEETLNRWATSFNGLPENIRKFVVIVND